MTDTQFDLFMTGDIAADTVRDVAINKLAILFKRPVDQVEKLINGKPSRVRKGLNSVELQRYQQAFKKIGVVTKAVPAGSTFQYSDQPQTDTATDRAATSSSTLSLCPSGTAVLNEDERQHPPIAAPETAHLSLASQGDNLSENPDIPIAAPDTDHIDLAPEGSPILSPTEPKDTPALTLDHISLCSSGTPLLDDMPKHVYKVPNTEHLKLK
ncbi:Uncharacterised protein [Zhongshania aliphaticivorans]|uniref:Uncharacterized protein n=1 Tax=Zhongshania aliphaticivorans TaxID=1470434 RepID=A0A5S9QB52_9GAMM|nr:hypothetical protein [Zhongshania aliphaticivorans]CAA0087492.1 Uncharacterised protein [Zhongshania aliphaticivorans]CAA0114978.1 Uncharacterised protein [Zhongshania aliphaticivorans]CAA0119786.1 Uncharacterised protein [Zhongshania aliphaticivorans]